MKQTLLNIASKLDERVKEFESFPRTQATDAMKGLGSDLVKIIRAEAAAIKGGSIEEQITAAVAQQLSDLTSPAKAAPKKKGGSK